MLQEESDVFAQFVRAHRDIEARVVLLERAADEICDGATRTSALATIADVLAYFEGPAAIHHADEQETLFPRLRPLEGSAQLLAAFEFQHQMNDATHGELRAALAAFVPGSASTLAQLALRFVEMQRAHIVAEERALFPFATAKLSPDVLMLIRDEMAARRGL